MVVLSPSWPLLLEPHARTFPSVPTAEPWLAPAAIAVAVSPLISTGEVRCVVLPSPSCPFVFRPQAYTLPSLFIARGEPITGRDRDDASDRDRHRLPAIGCGPVAQLAVVVAAPRPG